jgi:predicted molibdopterin-dependent oxidoreductase YjgC
LIKKIFGDGYGTYISILPPRIEGNEEEFGDGFVIRQEKAPNSAGALKALGLKTSPAKEFKKLADKAKHGEINFLIIFNGDPSFKIEKEDLAAIRKAKYIFVTEPYKTMLGQNADLLLAGNMPAEKEGTFTNSKGYVQRIRQAVFKPGQSEPEWKILLEIAKQTRISVNASHPRGIFEKLSKENHSFSDMDYETIGSSGQKCKD